MKRVMAKANEPEPFEGVSGFLFGLVFVACGAWCIIGMFNLASVGHMRPAWKQYLFVGSLVGSWVFLAKFSLRFTESQRQLRKDKLRHTA